MGSSMMSSTRNGSSSKQVLAVVVATTMIPFACSEEIIKFCKNAYQPPVCTAQAEGATNYNDTLKNLIESTLELNIDLQKKIPDLYSNFKTSKESSIKACNFNFGGFKESLNETLKALAVNDTLSVNMMDSNIKWSDCQDIFENLKLEFPPKFPPKLSELLDEMSVYKSKISALTHEEDEY